MVPGKFYRRAIRIAFGVAAALLLSVAAFELHFNLSSATSVHLLLITVIALKWGLPEASVVSLVSVGCLDYLFTQPLFRFYISDSHDWVALATFESVALVVSRLSTEVSRHAEDAEMHRMRLQRLYELSQKMLYLDFQKPMEAELAELIRATLPARGVALWTAYDLRLSRSGICDIAAEEIRAVFYAESNEDNPVDGVSHRTVRSGTRPIGVLVVQGHAADAASMNAVVSLVAVALERARSFTAQSGAEAARQSEQLRAAVLDALAHAFKSPLTVIQASSSGLLEMNSLAPNERRLVALIDRHATHLSEITTRLLRVAKFDSASLRPKRQAIDLAELVRESVVECGGQAVQPAVQIRLESEPMKAFADRHLLKMALLQLLDNAAKYGAADGSIVIDVHQDHFESRIDIHNDGSFLSPAERSRIFDRFYRAPGAEHRASGSGIGLSVVKHIVEAHHGRVWVASEPSQGTTFFLAIPTGRD